MILKINSTRGHTGSLLVYFYTRQWIFGTDDANTINITQNHYQDTRIITSITITQHSYQDTRILTW